MVTQNNLVAVMRTHYRQYWNWDSACAAAVRAVVLQEIVFELHHDIELSTTSCDNCLMTAHVWTTWCHRVSADRDSLVNACAGTQRVCRSSLSTVVLCKLCSNIAQFKRDAAFSASFKLYAIKVDFCRTTDAMLWSQSYNHSLAG